MISKNITKGAKVWHEVYGAFTFSYYDESGNAVVENGRWLMAIPRKELTEIDNGGK